MNNSKKAFTLAEICLVLFIWGVISILTIRVFNAVGKYLAKVRLKNINIEFTNALNTVITNPYYYSIDGDLAEIDEVTIENTDGTINIYSGKDKFRGLLLRELKIMESNPTNCFMMVKDKEIKNDNCYQGTNDIIWGIPETDFDGKNVVSSQDASGSVYKYVPITVYPTQAKHSTLEDFNKYALVFGVRRDGDVTMISNIDCSNPAYKEYNQCSFIEFTTSKKNK